MFLLKTLVFIVFTTLIFLPIIAIPYYDKKMLSPINRNKLNLCSRCEKLSRNYQNQLNDGNCAHCDSWIGIEIQDGFKANRELKKWAKNQPGFPKISVREWLSLKVLEIEMIIKNRAKSAQETIQQHEIKEPSNEWLEKIMKKK